MNSAPAAELLRVYDRIRERIERRLDEFREVWEHGSECRLFLELVFCLLTPASRARSAWEALQKLERKNVLLPGRLPSHQAVSEELNLVRFKNNKATNVLRALSLFCRDGKFSVREKLEGLPSEHAKREWLVSEVRGLGYKEASHFLRNVGFFQNLVILDRHVLRNLHLLGDIREVQSSLGRKRYLELEECVKTCAGELDMPAAHLDMVMWYRETGDIFK
jgi:N-glycosylase/DNA lyase